MAAMSVADEARARVSWNLLCVAPDLLAWSRVVVDKLKAVGERLEASGSPEAAHVGALAWTLEQFVQAGERPDSVD